jgi:glutamate dehydrogenase (NAD(P)+)
MGEKHPGMITGKPIPIGGSQGRGDATARGGIYVIREAATAYGIDLQGKPMAIQGFGNAGQYAALLGENALELKLIAASDSKGGVYNPKGINVEELIDYKIKNGKVSGFPGADEITNEELLKLEVVVLIPSALENVITRENAQRINCKILCELANGPTTPEADDILYEKGVVVLPDFLANAGGVTVSYLEQVQNTYNLYWEIEEIHWRLKEKMTRAFNSVYEMSQGRKINMRQAAYLVAVARVAEACKLRGWV